MKPLTIRMKADDVAEVLMYDVIGEDFFGGISAKAFREQIKGIKAKTMNLRINSPGGSVTEASAMLNALDEWKGRIEVDIDGLAASAASWVAMVGDVVRIASSGLMMIHNPHAGVHGFAEDFRRVADLLDKIRDQSIDTYSRKTKASREQIAAWLDAETWFTGKEAVEAGLADEVSEPLRMAAMADYVKLFDKLGFKHAPKIEDAAPPPDAMEETRKRMAIAARL